MSHLDAVELMVKPTTFGGWFYFSGNRIEIIQEEQYEEEHVVLDNGFSIVHLAA